MAKYIIFILTLINPLLSFPFSLYAIYHDKKNWRIYIFSMTMFFATMSYCYTPSTDPDLFRYWLMVHQISNMDFGDALFYGYSGDGDIILYTFNFMTWIVSILGDIHLLSTISTFVVYYIAFYITCYIGESSEVDWKHTFGYLVFIMCVLNWFIIADTVRNIMAFSIVGFAIFRDVYQRRKNLVTLILYVIPVFLHPTALIFIAIRLTLNLTSKLKIIFLSLIMFATAIINFIYKTFSTMLDIPLLRSVINKAYYYFNDTSSSWGLAVQKSGYHTVQKTAYISFAILMCVYAILNGRVEKDTMPKFDVKTVGFQGCTFMVGILTIGCIPVITPEYSRFASALITLGGVIYIPYIKTKLYKKSALFITIYSYALSALGVLMNMWQINANVKDVTNFLSQMIFTCPLFILLKDLFYFISH